ncbi:MAG: hypothetical protein GY774_20685 [Planctomycetes bacterium]|nr:hypothetical protein [Planctomycetota bacterium]
MIVGDTTGLMSLKYGGRYKLPERDSYKVTGQAFESTSINGGLSRQFVQFMNAPYTVSANYVAMDQAEAQFLFNFFNINRGKKFIAQLMVGGQLEEFVVQRKDNAAQGLTGINGKFSVTLEVEPAVDHCFIDWTTTNYQCLSGADWAKVFCITKGALDQWL